MTTTPTDVLQAVKFEERVAEIELRIPTTLALALQEKTLAKRNQLRRQLYRDSELLRVELEEQMNAHGIEAQWLTAPEIRAANEKLDAVRKQLKLDVAPAAHTLFEKVSTVVRIATVLLVLIGWFSAVFLLLPLRWLTPWLRQLGVKKNYLPMDIISWGLAYMTCVACGSDTIVEGAENLLNLKDSVMVMFSHASNLDGFLVNASSPIALKFAAKKSLFMVPALGWGARWCLEFVAIDRARRSQALKSLKELAISMNERGNSVSISPEGTRSKDGLLQDFKRGPFYLREDTKKNVIPAIVFGAYELWPPGRIISLPGRTLVRYFPEFVVDPNKNRNENRLALRRIYLNAFAEDVPDDIGTVTDTNGLVLNFFQIALAWAISIKVLSISLSVIGALCDIIGLSYWGFVQLSLLTSIIIEGVMFFTC